MPLLTTLDGLWKLWCVRCPQPDSLACALFALLPHPRYNLLNEARIREFPPEGVIKFSLAFVAETLRGLHHTLFFLFLAGLAVPLYNAHSTVLTLVAVWVGRVIMAYVCCTYVPVLSSNNPPLSTTDLVPHPNISRDSQISSLVHLLWYRLYVLETLGGHLSQTP